MWDPFKIQSPHFRPLWIRSMIVGFTLAWAGFEAWNGNLIWAAVFGAAGLYCLYQFFIAFDPDGGEGRDE